MEMQQINLGGGHYGYAFFNAVPVYENFSGRESSMNKKGARNFNIFIDNKQDADILVAEGFNVREYKKYKEGDPDRWTLKINFDLDKGSELAGASNGQKIPYSNANVGVLDSANIDYIDFVIRKFEYDVGKASAWLNSGIVYLIPSVLDQRFKERYPETINPDAIGPSEFDDGEDLPF